MKNCPTTDQDLFLLSRGELAPLKGLTVRAHVIACPTCRARVAEFRKLSALLREGYTGLPPLPPLWQQMPVFPIGLLVLAAVASTAFVVSRAHAPAGKANAAPIHIADRGDGLRRVACVGVVKPPIPNRDPRTFATFRNVHPRLATPGQAPAPKPHGHRHRTISRA